MAYLNGNVPSIRLKCSTIPEIASGTWVQAHMVSQKLRKCYLKFYINIKIKIGRKIRLGTPEGLYALCTVKICIFIPKNVKRAIFMLVFDT
jgi:hypothetical protein